VEGCRPKERPGAGTALFTFAMTDHYAAWSDNRLEREAATLNLGLRTNHTTPTTIPTTG
jgi:hypothetical protein